METRQSLGPRHDLIHSIPQAAVIEAARSQGWNSILEKPEFFAKLPVSLVSDTTKIFFWTSTYVGW
jgi:hypothetical protein